MKEFNQEKLEQELKIELRAMRVPDGAAETIAKRVTKEVSDWTKKKKVITTSDLNREISEVAKKYNQDLSYVYQNRDKII